MQSGLSKKLFCKFLNTTTFLVVVSAFAHQCHAAPEGGIVTGGTASIHQTGPSTLIQQGSDRAIIKWNSFDLKNNENVRFEQPSANSITVNRITDSKASQIDGNISANGKLVMINPNGVVFGDTATVDVGSLVATSSDMENDAAFLAGAPAAFTKSGKADASIINAGTITAREAGLIGFVAPRVENSGTIRAKLGKIQLSSGDMHTVDLAGDGLIQLEISDKALSQSIKNTGTLEADGGEVIMSAAEGRAAIDAIIANHGRIQTGTVFAGGQNATPPKTGKITITAPTRNRPNSKIVNTGTMTATGGDILVVAADITLGKTSNISVASANGGGSIKIGGARQGGGSIPTAQTLTVEKGAVINASAEQNGNGGEVILWSDKHTNFAGLVTSTGGRDGGNGGSVEVSGKKRLSYHGFVDLTAANGEMGDLLLDPTDILIAALPDQNVTGTSPFTPSIDDGPSVLDVATLTTALGSANVTVQTLATGSQDGDITIDAPITWASTNTLTLNAHDEIIINQAITGRNLVLTSNYDIQINAALAGTGALTISGAPTTSIGLGTAQIGDLYLDDTELGFITNGWTSLDFGSTTMTSDINVGAFTWNDSVRFITSTGNVSINGTQTMSNNNFIIASNGNPTIGAAINGTGTLSILQGTNAGTMGIGTGQAGSIQLSDLELSYISNGWTSLVFGLATGTGTINVGARTWQDNLFLRSRTGIININGAQNLGSNTLTISTDSNLNIGAALTGTGTLNITPGTNTSMGIGTGQAGTIQLSDAELNNITDGWGNIIFGLTTSTAAMNIGAKTWNDNVTFRTGSGLMTVAGVQNVGANNLSLQTDSNLALNAALNGSGYLTIRGMSNGTSMGIGTGQTGTLGLNDTELGRISNGWTRIDFGHTAATGAMNIGAATWSDPVRFITNTGLMTINGAQNMGTNNLDILTSADPSINAILSGTGALTIQGATAGTTIGIGDGQTGTLQLSNADLAQLSAGWGSIQFGSAAMTGAMNLGTYTWQYNTIFRTGSGLISVNGAQNSGSRDMTFLTDSSLAINAALQGGGTLSISGSANGTTMGVGSGQAGTLSLTNAELDFITDGWSKILLGLPTGTAAVNVGARTWVDPLQVRSDTGVITIAGQQSMGANQLILETNSNLAINANLVGTGDLWIMGGAVGTTIGVNGGAGSLALSTAEVARIVDGWGSVLIGRPDMTGAISLGAATWENPTTFQTRGDINISGIQTSTETSGSSLVFVTDNGSFTNTAGASAINPGGGRYLIYAVAPASTTLGGLTPPTTINNQSYYSMPPASVASAGDTIIYNAGAPKVLLFKIDDKYKVYGDALPIFTYTYLGGLQGSDTLGSALTSVSLNALGTSLTDNAGTTWAITGSFLTALGYTTNVTDGIMTVTKAPVTVQTSAATRTYGAADPIFNINYIGLKNGETSSVIDTLATGTTPATATSNVGTYALSASGAVDNNYIFNYSAPTTLTITKANLTITADNITRAYGDANNLTMSYSGLMNGENSSVIDVLPTLSTTADATTSPTSTAISISGGSDNNYNISLVGGTLTVTKATLTATADNKTREYGDANPILTVTYSGFKNGETSAVIDTLATASTTATNTTNVGTAIISAAGANDDNYDFTYIDGSLSITKAMLTATADNKTREYGDANVLTVTYSGFKNGETSAVINTLASVSTTATNTTNAGTTSVISASAANDNNYDFTYVDGALSITKAMLTATADNKTREYGDANILTATYTGFKNGENSSVIDTLATTSTTATNLTAPGTAAIAIAGANDNNYDFTYVNGTLNITKANLLVTADSITRKYNGITPALTYTFGPFKNGETSAVLASLPTISTTAPNTLGRGRYPITLSAGLDANYNFVLQDGLVTILGSPLPSTVYYTNAMDTLYAWDKWRDLIYYEDDEFIEKILFGRQTVTRKYAAL